VLELRRDDGPWIAPTDRARIDRDGFVWILQRVDDVIVRGGFKIHPAEVEGSLLSHPSVDEAVVVGVPDARLGSVPAAMVTLRPGGPLVTEEELRMHVQGADGRTSRR
jgi:acyl-coenzyme A synthetase/AMP-(fatty) acid ligase